MISSPGSTTTASIAVLPAPPEGARFTSPRKSARPSPEQIADDHAIPSITVSIGVATFPSCADNVFSLFDAADEALARAHDQGRNQACSLRALRQYRRVSSHSSASERDRALVRSHRDNSRSPDHGSDDESDPRLRSFVPVSAVGR